MKRFRYQLIAALVFISHMHSTKAQDWPALGHFKEANKTISPPQADEDRVVFMGNSITIGWLNAVPEFFKDKPYINRGIAGQTTPQMLLRFRQDVVDLNPKVVVILAGTNDIAQNTGPISLEEIMDNLESMAEIAKANSIKVVLSSVLPAQDYAWRPGLMPDKKIPKLNAMIKAYCQKENHVYLDYFSAMSNDKNGLDEDLAHDGVHPTKKGYAIMEPMVESAIKMALERK